MSVPKRNFLNVVSGELTLVRQLKPFVDRATHLLNQ